MLSVLLQGINSMHSSSYLFQSFFFLCRNSAFSSLYILIKITQCQDLVRIFLQNLTTDFDETLHVAWVCPGEGFGNSGRSGYSPVQKKGGRRPP